MTGSRAFSICGPALWNALSVPIRKAKTILTFRKLLKSHLFDLAFPPSAARCEAKSNDHAKSNDLPVSEQISRDFVRGNQYCVTYRMHKL